MALERKEDDPRNTPPDPDLLREMETADFLGCGGGVTAKDGLNIFMPK